MLRHHPTMAGLEWLNGYPAIRLPALTRSVRLNRRTPGPTDNPRGAVSVTNDLDPKVVRRKACVNRRQRPNHHGCVISDHSDVIGDMNYNAVSGASAV